ncbi:MAG: FxsA family protein, partial [Pseudomonadota bacterium]
QNNMADGKIPVEAAVDGVFLAIAAPFLMTPGFLTDIVGFSLLVPPVRRLLARAALNRFRRAVERGDATITVRRF